MPSLDVLVTLTVINRTMGQTLTSCLPISHCQTCKENYTEARRISELRRCPYLQKKKLMSFQVHPLANDMRERGANHIRTLDQCRSSRVDGKKHVSSRKVHLEIRYVNLSLLVYFMV